MNNKQNRGYFAMNIGIKIKTFVFSISRFVDQYMKEI